MHRLKQIHFVFDKIPSITDPSVLQDTLVAHTDAVWGLSIHSSKMQLLSCSSDGTVRLWSPGNKSSLLNTFRVDEGQRVLCKICLIHRLCN